MSRDLQDLADLENKLDLAADYFSQNMVMESAAIFIGTTRSGKSTLINYLMGNQLVGKKIIPHLPVFVEKIDQSPGPQIGQGASSETKIPTRWKCVKLPKLGLWDAPGFNDTRGVVQDIVNAFYINQFFQTVCQTKIVLVTDINDINQGYVSPLLQLFNSVENIFNQHTDACFGSIAIIFTKVPEVSNGQKVDKSCISNLLKYYASTKDIAMSEFSRKLMLCISENAEKCIGFLKLAEEGKVIDDSFDVDIVKAIQEVSYLKQECLKQITPSISKESQVFLFNVRERLVSTENFDELQTLIIHVIKNSLENFDMEGDISFTREQLQSIKVKISMFKNKIECLHVEQNLLAKMEQLGSLHSEVDTFMKQNNLLHKAKYMNFVDCLLKLKKSELYERNINFIIQNANSDCEILEGIADLKLKQIDLEDAQKLAEDEAEARAATEIIAETENEKRIETEKELELANQKTSEALQKEHVAFIAKIEAEIIAETENKKRIETEKELELANQKTSEALQKEHVAFVAKIEAEIIAETENKKRIETEKELELANQKTSEALQKEHVAFVAKIEAEAALESNRKARTEAESRAELAVKAKIEAEQNLKAQQAALAKRKHRRNFWQEVGHAISSVFFSARWVGNEPADISLSVGQKK